MESTEKRSSSFDQAWFAVLTVLLLAVAVAFQGIAHPDWQLGSHRDRTTLDLLNARQAITLFRMVEGRLPMESEWPAFLRDGSEHRQQRYLDDVVTNDGFRDCWGNPYHYLRTGDGYLLIAHGADGRPGGEGQNADIELR